MSDFGEGRCLIGRKAHRCEMCFARIPKGERHYNYRGMYDGEWQNWRAHVECYDAYVADGDDEFMPGELPIPDAVRSRLAMSVEGGSHA